MREVFIFGTSHSLQCGVACRPESIAALEAEIRRLLSEHQIGRIVEEMSEDGLAETTEGQASRGTVCQRMAGDIPVVFVDLSHNERKTLCLANSQIDNFMLAHGRSDGERMWVRDAFSDLSAEVRERVWVARVLSGAEWPVLFVCGADHAAAVRALFTRVGVRSRVVHRDFDPDGYA